MESGHVTLGKLAHVRTDVKHMKLPILIGIVTDSMT